MPLLYIKNHGGARQASVPSTAVVSSHPQGIGMYNVQYMCICNISWYANLL